MRNVLGEEGKISSPQEISSIIFSALSADRQHESVCADNGANGNITEEATFWRIASAGSQVDVHP